MIIEMFYDPTTWWLLGTAVLFTGMGYYFSMKSTVTMTVTATIDSLIEEGYIKTKLENNEVILIKHTDWQKGE